MLATREVLLADEALMGLLGFNATQVEPGCTRRGLSRRTEPVAIRGPFSYETVADGIVQVGPEKLAAMFNGAIRCLAARGVFPKGIDAVVDTTDDEATPTYHTDDGRPVPSVTRKKRADVRANRHGRKMEVTVWGWKLWLVVFMGERFGIFRQWELAMLSGLRVREREEMGESVETVLRRYAASGAAGRPAAIAASTGSADGPAHEEGGSGGDAPRG
jgi:hypothetical protein